MKTLLRVVAVFVLWGGITLTPLFATEYSSTNFRVHDPVLNSGGVGAAATSTSYRLQGVISEVAVGRLTATSFTVNAGSLTFPVATAPVLTATAGAEQAALSWTASQGSLGWTISSYEVCQGTTTNTYDSCTDVGNVTSSTRTGLTAGTQYFFRIRAEDAFGNVVVRSNEAAATPTAATGGEGTPSGGGDAGGSTGSQVTAVDVVLSGRAYSNATVSLFQNGTVVQTTTAGGDGNFTGRISAVQAGRSYTFGAQARDSSSRSSVLLTYTVNVPTGVTQVTIENIFLPPTIELSAASVTQGDPVTVRGTAFPAAAVRVEVAQGITQTTAAGADGVWSTALDTGAIDPGTYNVRADALVGGERSDQSGSLELIIASVPAPPPPPPACPGGSDISGDGSINLSDVSILLTFWGQANPVNQCSDISGDGRVDLVDFSILLFNWTG